MLISRSAGGPYIKTGRPLQTVATVVNVADPFGVLFYFMTDSGDTYGVSCHKALFDSPKPRYRIVRVDEEGFHLETHKDVDVIQENEYK